MGHFYRFVGGDPRAGDAARRCGIQTVRHFYRIIGGHDALFSHPTVNGITRVFHIPAQGFVAGITVFAVSTAFKKPCHARTVANFQRVDAWANLFNDPYSFVTQDHPGLIAEITVLHVKIGMTYAAAFHLQQGFSMLKRT